MTVLRHENGNIGGINPIQYAFKEDISGFSINPETLIASVSFNQGKGWNYLYGSPETIQLEGKEDETPSGKKYSYTVKMLVPKDRRDVEVILMSLNNRHLILNIIDKNGVARYFGTLQSPMKKIGKLIKPANAEGYHGWEVVFSGEFSSPASYSPDTVTLPVITPDPLE